MTVLDATATTVEADATRDAVRSAIRPWAAFDLKGVMSSLTVLKLRTTDLGAIERQLRTKVVQLPQLFRGAPIVVDVGGFEGGLPGFPWAALVHAMRACGVAPVAVVNATDGDQEVARGAGLGSIKIAGMRAREAPAEAEPTEAALDVHAVEVPAEEPPARSAPRERRTRANAQGRANRTAESRTERTEAPPDAAPPPAVHKPPIVLREPVRAGQEIYARQTDLIVLAPVNAGAQLYADGHIHIYAPMRGRAMAGSQGLTEARIFVQKLEAELVAVAGAYLLAEEIPAEFRGKPAQVYLEGGECRIASL